MIYLGNQAVGLNNKIEPSATLEIPRKWKRPSDWPNLDLINFTNETQVAWYITIFCDGSWTQLPTNSGITGGDEVLLDNYGNITVIQPLTFIGNYNFVDVSNFSNGIHLLRLTGEPAQFYLLYNNYSWIYTKTLEVKVFFNNIRMTLNTGSQLDILCGLSPTTEHISIYNCGNGDLSTGNIMIAPFANCGNLKSIEIYNSNLTIATAYIIRNCDSLIEFITRGSTLIERDSTQAPNPINCFNLTTLDWSDIDFSDANYATSNEIQKYCLNLTNFSGLINCNASQDYSRCIKLTHESLLNIINALPLVDTERTLTLGEILLAKISSNEIAIATSKGWRVV